MSLLRDPFSRYWRSIQGNLFPWLREEIGELTENQQRLMTTLDLPRIEEYLPGGWGWP